MAGVAARIGQAAAVHRRAAAAAGAAGAALAAPTTRTSTTERSVRELAERLRVAGALLAPGWLGARLDAVSPSTPIGEAAGPELVRIGTAYPLDDASFPVVVPFGHLAFDGDARDPRVAGVLRSVLLRLLASTWPGSMVVRTVDASGAAFGDGGPFHALHDAGIMPPPVTDRSGLCAVLTEAEQWVARPRPPGDPVRTMLLAVAAWPEATEPVELSRVSALASAGPPAGLHLVLAGWPPLLLGEDATEPMSMSTGRSGPPLPHATRVQLRNPYALVGNPPEGSFSAAVPGAAVPGAAASGTAVPGAATPPAGLAARVFLDDPPPADLVTRICHELATRATGAARAALGDVLPSDPIWTGDAAAGLEAVVGRSGEAPVALRLTAASPHCLVAGRRGSGTTALILDLLYGLCTRYGPDQLRCYLLDFTGNGSFARFVPDARDRSYLPHARAVGVEPDREGGVAVLRGLATEHNGRKQPGGGPADRGPVPRILCTIDGAGALLEPDDDIAREAATLLESFAVDGGAYGIHLVLAGVLDGLLEGGGLPETVARHCRNRIALPGGAGVLDPANQAAADLELGEAVVNTAGGLGGPARVTRAHEQRVRFPDPYPHAAVLAGLRHRLWRAGWSGPGRWVGGGP